MQPPKSEVESKCKVAFIDPKKCIGCGECILTCPTGAVQIQWNETIPLFQKKMVEYAYGAACKKKERPSISTSSPKSRLPVIVWVFGHSHCE